MNGFKQTLSIHRWAVILGILVSLIVAFPQSYFRIEHRNDPVYQGIELLPDSPWAARVREIQDGNGFGSIYYKDGKGDPYLHLPFGSMTVAYMGKAFSLDINNTILLSRFVLPFFATLLIYAFVYYLSRDKLAALCSAAVILLADSILGLSGVTRILQGISPSSFLELSRPVYSAMIFIPFFAFLACFWQFLQKRNLHALPAQAWQVGHTGWRWGVASAALLGLNFYNYFYTWTYIYAFMAVLALIFIIKKRWQELKLVTSVALGALVVAVPYFVNLYKASLYPTYEEVGLRHGIVTSHTPIFVGLTVLAALVIFLIWFSREDKEKYYFSLALLLTPFLTLNQQIITGKVLQEGHYHWYFHRPIAVIFVLIIIFYWLSRRGLVSYKKILASLIVLVSLATGTYIQAWSYYIDYPTRDGGAIAIERQKYGPVVDWLNENANKNEVVFANIETSHVTVVYTPLNVFHHKSVQLFLSATEERLLEAIFTFFRLRQVGRDDAQDIFSKESKRISADVYGVYFRDNFESYDIPPEKLKEIVALYEKTLSTPTAEWLYKIWAKYEVNYLVWDKVKDPIWQLDRFSKLEKMAEFGDMVIYRFNQ
jgi:hypothetical protein